MGTRRSKLDVKPPLCCGSRLMSRQSSHRLDMPLITYLMRSKMFEGKNPEIIGRWGGRDRYVVQIIRPLYIVERPEHIAIASVTWRTNRKITKIFKAVQAELLTAKSDQHMGRFPEDRAILDAVLANMSVSWMLTVPFSRKPTVGQAVQLLRAFLDRLSDFTSTHTPLKYFAALESGRGQWHWHILTEDIVPSRDASKLVSWKRKVAMLWSTTSLPGGDRICERPNEKAIRQSGKFLNPVYNRWGAVDYLMKEARQKRAIGIDIGPTEIDWPYDTNIFPSGNKAALNSIALKSVVC